MDDPTLTHPGDPVDPMPNPRVSEDGREVDGWIENWGMDVLATLTAEKHQLVSAADCGSGSHQDARPNSTVVFHVPSQCIQLAVIEWKLKDGSQGTISVGEPGSPALGMQLANVAVDNTDTIYTYAFLK